MLSFTLEGSKIYLTDEVKILEKLDSSNYLLSDSDRGLCLIAKPPFQNLPKIYGDLLESAKKYLNTYLTLNRGIGVLLSGHKGSGKSLMSRVIAIESGLPCIIISEYFEGHKLLDFITKLEQKAIILIDEFEKLYNTEEKQNEMLSILDGVFATNKMFVLTSNSAKISPFLLNRTGRIRYHKKFEGLKDEVIEEIIVDIIKDISHKNELLLLTKSLGVVTFDTLTTIINEMNLYNESPREALSNLNIEPEEVMYKVVLLIDGKRYVTDYFGHPLASESCSIQYKKDNERWWGSDVYTFNVRDFSAIFGDNGRIDLKHKERPDTIIFERVVKGNSEFNNLFDI